MFWRGRKIGFLVKFRDFLSGPPTISPPIDLSRRDESNDISYVGFGAVLADFVITRVKNSEIWIDFFDQSKYRSGCVGGV